MKSSYVLAAAGFVVAGYMTVGSAALAGPDDAKWVAACISDNKDAKVSVEIVTKYCTCMNNKMDESETQSITQWEKAHATERAACDKQSGWK